MDASGYINQTFYPLITSVAENHWKKIGKLVTESKEIPIMGRYPCMYHNIKFGGYSMKKSSLFISTLLTTFVLAILGGVFTVNRALTTPVQASAPGLVQLPSAIPPTPVTPATPATIPTIPGIVSPEEAAQIAAHITGYGKLYSVETTLFGGTDTYKVTFSSGNIAYMDLQGKLVAAFLAPRQTVSSSSSLAASNSSAAASNSFPSNSGSDSGGEHEGNEHEGGD
jgi:hypothetical protein